MGRGRAGGGRVRRALRVSEGRGKHMWGRVCASGFRHAERGGVNQGTARFAHFAHFFQRKGVERGLTFFFFFCGEKKKKSPAHPWDFAPRRGVQTLQRLLFKRRANSQILNFEFWVQEGHGHPPPGPGRAQAGQEGHGRVLLSQATTRRPSACGCSLRAPPPLSAKATSACFCAAAAAAAVTASPAPAARAAPRPGSVLGRWGWCWA